MKLASVEQSKFDAGRCTVTFENGEKLKTFMSVVADMGLYSGMELDGEELAVLKNASRTMGAKARAARIAGAAPVSRAQLVKKLKEKGETEADAENAADWLENIGAVSDADYAEMLVRNLSARGYGKARIRQKLREKGVPRELWDDALAQMPESDEALEKYIRAHLDENETDRKKIKKVSDALLRRGFSWSEISEALARVTSGDTSED